MDPTTTAPTGGAAPAGTTEATPPARQDTTQKGPGHHSERQPREDGTKRFNGPPGDPLSQASAEPTTRKLKVTYREHGQDVEEELSDEELIESRRQLRALKHKEAESTKRFQRAGELVKETEETRLLAKAIEEGDYSKIRDYYAKKGKQPVDVLASLLEKALDERDMDPKERAIAERESKLAAREAEIAKAEEERETGEFMAQVKQQREALHGTWGHLLEQEGLPKTEHMLDVSASIFLEVVEATGKAPAPEQIAHLTRWHLIDATAKPLVNGLEAPQFMKHFGGEGSILQKLDQTMTPEAFLESFPGLAGRFHQHLVKLARQQGTRREPAATRREQAPDGARGGGEKREIMLPSSMMTGVGS